MLQTNAQTQAAELPQLPDCPICLEEVSSMDSFTVSSCGHSLHFACARATVLDAIRCTALPLLEHCAAVQAGRNMMIDDLSPRLLAHILLPCSTGSVPIMCPACQAGEGDCR